MNEANLVRTDLALEAREAAGEIPGVSMEQEELDGTTITRVKVFSPEGARALGKPMGNYITLENAALSEAEALRGGELGAVIAREIRALLKAGEDACPMVAGLGNRNLTPDSLGPRVTEALFISRHIKETMPELLDQKVRPVCAVSPGVMGETGIETGELILAAVRAVKPSCLIVVDSLAARSASRVLGTVQISDAGVSPGSGVGNHRSALTRQSLSLPVIAIGVPMVVHAAVIGRDTLERAIDEIAGGAGENSALAKELAAYREGRALDGLLRRAQGELMQNFVVTPISIDEAVRNVAQLVAEGINLCLQPEMSREEILALTL
ncbi:MAG: GPR endopeptidase [Christensenellaceae bacterium]|nr:GPR endopeptidase [Christensenellaceae bacterium]